MNGHRKDEESGCQVPVIDDSVIVDDDEGLPFISAVYSLATNEKTEERAMSDSNSIDILNSRSTAGASAPIINVGTLSSSSVVKSSNLSNSDSVSLDLSRGIATTTGQNQGRPTTQNFGNGTVVNRTQNEIAYSSDLESRDQKTSSRVTEAIPQTTYTVTDTASNLQPAGNMSHLVRLVNRVNNSDAPKASSSSSSSTSTTAASNLSPPLRVPVKQVPTSRNVGAAPVTHLPRQIAMKQPSPTFTSKQTSIVLNLKPGESIPKVINLMGPDGKSVVLLTLSDGGKQLVSPTGSPNMGGKVVIPIPASVASSVSVAPKVSHVNKVYPIAPLPGKTTTASPQASVTPRLLSVSGSQKTPAVSSDVSSAVSASVPSSSQSRVSVTNAGASGGELASSAGVTPATFPKPTNVRPLEPNPSSLTVETSTGLSPQESRIQRLKELIKRQEEAVNKLREKRRLEIDRIRDPSLTSKLEHDSETEDSVKSERVPLAEQKRPSSPFAVPLPPKKRTKDSDSNFRSRVSRASGTSATPDGAFIPNADDKSFVQLVGLENVVNNIK